MERSIEFNGLTGRHWFSIPNDPRQANQMKFSKQIIPGHYILAKLRYDDTCKNGHRTFAITGETYSINNKGRKVEETGGCIHDDIAKYFPQLAHLIKWHLVSEDGPMHYPANVTYLAGALDCYGHAKGDPCQWETRVFVGDSPLGHIVKKSLREFIAANPGKRDYQALPIPYIPTERTNYKLAPKYSLMGLDCKWHEASFDSLAEANEWIEALNAGFPIREVKTATRFSEGKARELASARCAAVWPDATDEQLCLPKAELTALLNARLPQLMADFHADLAEIGLEGFESEVSL